MFSYIELINYKLNMDRGLCHVSVTSKTLGDKLEAWQIIMREKIKIKKDVNEK